MIRVISITAFAMCGGNALPNTGVQDLNMNWQLTTGNLLYRMDAVKSKIETFTYDNLNRLNTAQVTGLQSYATNFAPNGNITNKTDAGTYQYDPNKIHALAQLNTPNNVSRWNQDVVYTKFQRPEKITENSTELIYTYGADYERRKAVLNANWATVYTRLYFGDYEMTTRNGVNQYVHYITGGDGVCAIGVKEGNNAFNFYVPYSDHLGSILTVTNTNGNIVAEQNFDAWGRKRNATTWDYANVATNPTWLYRGYTGHEHLPEFNLINMNARLYDPVLGRMLSPDNLVSMGGSQGLNRYTYAYNNPMKYADLDGNCPICIGAAIGAGIDIAIQWYTKGRIDWDQVGLAAISGAVGGGVGAWVGGSAALATSSAVVQGAISGAAAGAASGLVSGYMNGQRGWDLAKTVGISAGVGAVVGGSTAYIKGRLFPDKPKGGIPSEQETGTSSSTNKGSDASALLYQDRVETSTGVTGTLKGAEIGEITVISKTTKIPISYSNNVVREVPELMGYTYHPRSAAKHWGEEVLRGRDAGLLARPYMRSPLMIQEIMSTGPGIPDATFNGGLNWKVSGYFRGSFGIWELGLNPETKVIYHFLWKP